MKKMKKMKKMMKMKMKISSDKSVLVIEVREVKIVKEVIACDASPVAIFLFHNMFSKTKNFPAFSRFIPSAPQVQIKVPFPCLPSEHWTTFLMLRYYVITSVSHPCIKQVGKKKQKVDEYKMS